MAASVENLPSSYFLPRQISTEDHGTLYHTTDFNDILGHKQGYVVMPQISLCLAFPLDKHPVKSKAFEPYNIFKRGLSQLRVLE